MGVDDATIYLLHRAYSHLDKGGCDVRVTYFDFSRVFNTIQPSLLSGKLERMQLNLYLMSWTTDYLTDRPQHVRLGDCISETVVSNMGATTGDCALSCPLYPLHLRLLVQFGNVPSSEAC